MKQPTVKTRNNEFLGIIMNNIENKLTTIKLNPRGRTNSPSRL